MLGASLPRPAVAAGNPERGSIRPSSSTRGPLPLPAPPVGPMVTHHGSDAGTAARRREREAMLKWALIFLVVSVVAGALGFSGISEVASRIARILFGIFLAIVVILLLLAVLAGELVF